MAQIIAVAVVFSDPARYTGFIMDGMKTLLGHYHESTEIGATAKAVWNVAMGVSIQLLVKPVRSVRST